MPDSLGVKVLECFDEDGPGGYALRTKWRSSVRQFIGKNSQGPDVQLQTTFNFTYNLWRHIERAA